MMFLNEAKSGEVLDLDEIESSAFGKRLKHRQEIRQEMRERFRKEYLSLLVHRNIRKSGYKTIKIGDVVIMEIENKKRVDWPIARVIQTYPGKDGVIRSVKIRFAKNGTVSEVNRPIQRLYMLESSIDNIKCLMKQNSNEDIIEAVIKDMVAEPDKAIKTNEEVKVTRGGRKVCKPERFGY